MGLRHNSVDAIKKNEKTTFSKFKFSPLENAILDTSIDKENLDAQISNNKLAELLKFRCEHSQREKIDKNSKNDQFRIIKTKRSFSMANNSQQVISGKVDGRSMFINKNLKENKAKNEFKGFHRKKSVAWIANQSNC